MIMKSSKKSSLKVTRQKSTSPAKSAPVAKGYSARSSAPAMSAGSPDGSIRIRRREFVGTISNSATTFELVDECTATPGYDFNPGVSTMFPWLATLAINFERFRIGALKFDFLPSAPTSTAGRIYAAVDYDFDDAVPSTKAVMMANRTAVECPVWEKLSIQCDTKLLHGDLPFKYINTTGRANFVEPRTSYCGFLIVAFDTPATVGSVKYDLWVSYDVTLSIPQIDGVLQEDTLPTAFPEGRWSTGALLPTQYSETEACRVVQLSSPPSKGCPVQQVATGVDSVPVLQNIFGVSPSKCLDLRKVGHGVLELAANLTVDGTLNPADAANPLTVGSVLAPTIEGYVYDAAGAVIGQLSNVVSAKLDNGFGSLAWGAGYTPSWAGVTSWAKTCLQATSTVLIEKLKRDLVKAAFLVPVLYATAATTSTGKLATGMRFGRLASDYNLVFGLGSEQRLCMSSAADLVSMAPPGRRAPPNTDPAGVSVNTPVPAAQPPGFSTAQQPRAVVRGYGPPQ